MEQQLGPGYTQVWSNYDKQWSNGSRVTAARLRSKTTGVYFDIRKKAYLDVPEDAVEFVRTSQYYLDYTWRKNNAVIGFLNSMIMHDASGNVTYRHDGKVRITHREG